MGFRYFLQNWLYDSHKPEEKPGFRDGKTGFGISGKGGKGGKGGAGGAVFSSGRRPGGSRGSAVRGSSVEWLYHEPFTDNGWLPTGLVEPNTDVDPAYTEQFTGWT